MKPYQFTYKSFFVAAAALLIVALSGCASSPTEWAPPASANAVFVIGSIDLSEAGGRLEGPIKVDRLQPEPEAVGTNFWRRMIGNDTYAFYAEVLTTGQYQLRSIESRFYFLDVHEDSRFRWNFSKPGVHYIGSYKLKVTKPEGGIGRMKIELVSVQEPRERELLMKILPGAKNEYWKNLLESRIRQLSH